MNREIFKTWAKAAGIRALKTICQVAVSMITVGQAVTEVNWKSVLSVSLVAGFISILTSVAGLPEVDQRIDKADEEAREEK